MGMLKRLERRVLALSLPARERLANLLLQDVHLREVWFGTNSVKVGDKLYFTDRTTATVKGELACDPSTGRFKYYDGTAERTVAGTHEAGNHAGLTNLGWGASGHTGTADRVAAFDGSGNASYLAVGSDIQAYSAALAAIAAGVIPLLVRPWVVVASFSAQPTVAANSFATMGLTDTTYPLTSSAGSTVLYKNGGKKLIKCVAPATTDGSVLAGLQPASNNSAMLAFHADSRWTVWFIHRSDAVLTYMRNGQTGVYASGINPTDAATGAANYAAIRWEADGSIVLAVAQASTQSTATIAAAGTIAVDTTYIGRLRWDGTSVYGTYAVIDASGNIGSWATEQSLSSNIPANTLVFNVQTRFFQVSSGGVARNWILGPFYGKLAFTTS